MATRHDSGWDRIYHQRSLEGLPWELGEPRKGLVDLVESKAIEPSQVLDLCCGAGTNPVYLAKNGFSVTALDISDKAVSYARNKAQEAEVNIDLLIGDFVNLPFNNREFSFIFDFGCFHHVNVENRIKFIQGIHRVLEPRGTYFLACFSYRNGSSWNHFRKNQIIDLFHKFFKIMRIKHVSSIEGDKVRRYFYEVFMEKINS